MMHRKLTLSLNVNVSSGNRGAVPGSSGDEIGKALASVSNENKSSASHHCLIRFAIDCLCKGIGLKHHLFSDLFFRPEQQCLFSVTIYSLRLARGCIRWVNSCTLFFLGPQGHLAFCIGFPVFQGSDEIFRMYCFHCDIAQSVSLAPSNGTRWKLFLQCIMLCICNLFCICCT